MSQELDETAAVDVGAYCRHVEGHLTRVNAGHLVRIVGPAFELVRSWAEHGVPLSVVTQAIDIKAERHLAGQSKHALRIEFCERDVLTIYDHWRRAVGLPADVFSRESAEGDVPADGSGADAPDTGVGAPTEDRRRPSLSKHLDRVIDRAGRAGGRLDTPEPLRAALAALLGELTTLRDDARGLRGAARDAVGEQLERLDTQLIADARGAAPAEVLEALAGEARAELAPYRGRLAGPAWDQGVQATVDRLLRERYGLPFVVMS